MRLEQNTHNKNAYLTLKTALETASNQQAVLHEHTTFSTLIETGYQLYELLSLCESAPATQAYLWEAMLPKLSTILTSGRQLAQLLSLSFFATHPDQQALLWSIAEKNPSIFLNNGIEISKLLILPTENFSVNQRSTLLRLSQECIHSSADFMAIALLPLEKASASLRKHFFSNLSSQTFSSWYFEPEDIKVLFECKNDQFPEEYRMPIFQTFLQSTKINQIHFPALVSLLTLSPEKLLLPLRNQLLDRLIEALRKKVIYLNAKTLHMLLSFDDIYLPSEKSDELWLFTGLVEEILMLRNGDQFLELLALPVTSFSETKRKVLIRSSLKNLPLLLQTPQQFFDLFQLSMTQFSAEDRTQVLAVLKEKLPHLIQNDMQLRRLFSLDEAQLSFELKKQIVSALNAHHAKVFLPPEQKKAPIEMLPFKTTTESQVFFGVLVKATQNNPDYAFEKILTALKSIYIAQQRDFKTVSDLNPQTLEIHLETLLLKKLAVFFLEQETKLQQHQAINESLFTFQQRCYTTQLNALKLEFSYQETLYTLRTDAEKKQNQFSSLWKKASTFNGHSLKEKFETTKKFISHIDNQLQWMAQYPEESLEDMPKNLLFKITDLAGKNGRLDVLRKSLEDTQEEHCNETVRHGSRRISVGSDGDERTFRMVTPV